MKSLKIGIVGAGLIADQHAISLSAIRSVKQLAFFDADAKRASNLARKYEGVAAQSLDDLVSETDLLWICTPPAFHMQAIVAAVDAKKPIFCEKPLGHTLDEANAIRTLIVRSKTPFYMGQSGRYSKCFRMIHKAVAKGDIGKPHNVWSIRQGYLNPKATPAWRMDDRKSGGAVVELGVHEIDFINWIAGPWKSVVAHGSSHLVGKKFTDTVSTLGTLQSGGTARIDLSWSNPRYLWQRGVDGEEGSIFFDDSVFNAFEIHRPGRKVRIVTTGEKDWKDPETGENLSFRAQNRTIIKAVLAGTAPEVTLDDGLAAVRVGHAIRSAVRSGQPVKV